MSELTRDIDFLRSLTIGTVDGVLAGEVRVLLTEEAPQSTALNSGFPTAFPRINGYVLLPTENGSIVGVVSALTVERSAYPKRTGLRDFGLIDLPYPSRRMSVLLVGTLMNVPRDGDECLEMRRGVFSFPSIGDSVVLPTQHQLKCIVESQSDEAVLHLGHAPLAANAAVRVSPDRLFARHVAVMGNTGSGKSCTVAGLIRWSLDAAAKNLAEGVERPNARFILLDPNGEYETAFADRVDDVRVFRVCLNEPKGGSSANPLEVPAWLWNSEEWAAFSQASGKTQRPLLNEALRGLRAGAQVGESRKVQLAGLLRGYRVGQRGMLGKLPNVDWKQTADWGRMTENLLKETDSWSGSVDLDDATKEALGALQVNAGAVLAGNSYVRRDGGTGYNDPAAMELEGIIAAVEDVLQTLPEATEFTDETADTPKPFDVSALPDFLDLLATTQNTGDISQFVSWLTMRIRFMLSDRRLSDVVNPSREVTLSRWLEDYIGSNEAENGQVVLIDLSLVPSEALQLVVAVLARLIFEALQRHRRLMNAELPTVLVLEEAHNFVHRSMGESESAASYMCHRVFERIAREGRKFGLGLMLSSQRPVELSPTVLSQCNTFLLHRLVNDRDQELVRSLVPDNLGALLRELPSLPTGYALLLGWAAEIPVLVKVSELPERQRPKSNDPSFWRTWIGEQERPIDWGAIANDWQGAADEHLEEREETVAYSDDSERGIVECSPPGFSMDESPNSLKGDESETAEAEGTGELDF